MQPADWIWMPHPAHLVVAQDCRFHLATYVGNWIVSTVGEYLPGESSREMYAKLRGVTLRGIGDERLADYMRKIGYGTIGYERLYETMVFRAELTPDTEPQCCPWRQDNGNEQEMRGYNDPADARRGHLELCHEWSVRSVEAVAAQE